MLISSKHAVDSGEDAQRGRTGSASRRRTEPGTATADESLCVTCSSEPYEVAVRLVEPIEGVDDRILLVSRRRCDQQEVDQAVEVVD